MTASKKQVGGDHYKDMAIQPGEFIYRNKLGWHEGNAVKYICRHGAKGGRVDIEKAIHYLELLLEREYGETSKATGVASAAAHHAREPHSSWPYVRPGDSDEGP